MSEFIRATLFRLVTGVSLCAAAALTATACEPTPASSPVVAAPAFLSNFAPMGYSPATGEVFGNRIGSDGAWNTYAVKVSDPASERSLTLNNPLYGDQPTHRGVSDVSPDGRYLLVEVERPSHFPCFSAKCAHAPEAQPGKGAYNQVWLATADGKQAWQLTDIDADHAYGTFWARFDRTGNRVVFAEITVPAGGPEYLGVEQLVVATIKWTNGIPALTDRVVTGAPGRFNEAYGFTPDGSAVIAASDLATPDQPMRSRIYRFPLDGSAPTLITTAFNDSYSEFAFYTPDTSRIIIGSTKNSYFGGMDYWSVDPANPAAAPVRITHQSDMSVGNYQYAIVGGIAFVPGGFIGSTSPDAQASTINSLRVPFPATG